MIMGNSKANSESGEKFDYYKLPGFKQRKLLECLAKKIEKFLKTSEMKPKFSTSQIMDEVGLEVLEKSIDSRAFGTVIKNLYSEGYIRLGYHLLSKLADKLHAKSGFGKLEKILVVAGSDAVRFARAAGEDFINRLVEISKYKRDRYKNSKDEQILNIGLISGRTTGSVIRAVLKLDWKKDIGINVDNLPYVRVFSLNGCLTLPAFLSGNSSILAYELNEKINSEAGKNIAQAYGLSAPLLVKNEQLEHEDHAPQTFEILKFTEPYRVRSKLQNNNKKRKSYNANETKLDIVLAGVGELPIRRESKSCDKLTSEPVTSGEGSIFYNLAKEFGFDMDKIISAEHIVGDIAFTAIRSDGESAKLCKNGTEYVFYSAVQLPILEAMAADKNKSVILVARDDENKYKVPAIYASIAERHRYASRLVLDEETARKLHRY